jgi:putative DNA primase/helicase
MTQKIIRPTDDELAVRWIEREQSAGRLWLWAKDWYTYRDGIWVNEDSELEVRSGIWDILKEAKAEGIRPTSSRLSSVMVGAGEGELAIDPKIFDQDPDLLVCDNGTLHLPTRKLGPHSPKHYMTQKVHYNYDPGAKAEVFEFALNEAVQGDQETADFLQEFAGYCLTTETKHELAVWFTGPPGSGKSTIVEGFLAMVGDMSMILGLADIQKGNFALSSLPGKRLAISTEQPAAYMDATHTLNAIISGELIRVDRKYRHAIEVNSVAKVLWAMNQLPRVHSAGDGLFRRVKIVKFKAIPKEDQDPAIKEAIKTEGAGILNWALDGLDRLRERGGFDVSKGVEIDTEAFQKTADVPSAFIDDVCDIGDDFEIKASILYEHYKEWTYKNGHKHQSRTSIAEDWERLGFEKIRKMDGIYYQGLRKKPLNL